MSVLGATRSISVRLECPIATPETQITMATVYSEAALTQHCARPRGLGETTWGECLSNYFRHVSRYYVRQ